MSSGDQAVAPDGVVHKIDMRVGGVGGVVCGAMKLNNGQVLGQSDYWLFWVQRPITCLACLALQEAPR